jgi:hypothetical protein
VEENDGNSRGRIVNTVLRISIIALLLVLASCSGDESKKSSMDVNNYEDLTPGVDLEQLDGVTHDLPGEDQVSPEDNWVDDQTADEVCVPDCQGKECGDDGCGTSCGECANSECSSEGLCDELPCTGNDDCADLDQVCDEDSGTCVDCLTSDDCAPEKYCDAMACLDDICGEEESKCEGNDGLVCLADGSGFEVVVTCTGTEYCDGGECLAQNCAPSEAYCDGQQVVQCDALGKEWVAGEDCAASQMFCFEGACISSACLPESVFCAEDGTLATCNADGTEYTSEPCPEGNFCSKGACLPWLCVPGEPMCQDNVATNCDSLGKGPVAGGENCLDQGLLCVAGLCTKCFPDCFGKECGDDGCGGTCGGCDDGDACTTGSCDDALFVCDYAPVADCCNSDDQCSDADDCTVDGCVNNGCVFTNICCGSHDDCDDGDDLCTHDLCLNQGCFYKPIPGAGCCPRTDLLEGFEFGVVNWSLTANNQHKWQLSTDTSAHGAYALLGNKANAGATLTLPGPTAVSWAGSSLRFAYVTQGWQGLDCATDGLVVQVNGKVAKRLCTPAEVWTEHVVDLSPWAGQTVTIQVIYGVPAKLPTNHAIYLDDVAIEHACCAGKADCDDGNVCTVDSCAQGACTHTPLVGCCSPALLQEDFEDFDAYGWSLSADGQKKWQLTGDDKHTGAMSLVATDQNANAVVTLPGTFAIPVAGGGVKVWFKTVSWNTITWGVDGLSLYANGVLVETVSTPSPGWSQRSFDLSTWAGHDVVLSFGYKMGGNGNPGHRVTLDDLQVVQSCCDLAEQCDDGLACTTDSCGNWGGCVNEPVADCCDPLVWNEDFDLGAVSGWALSNGAPQAWKITNADSASGDYSLTAAQATNGAEVTLPVLPALPANGGSLTFSYKTVNWAAINCATDGLRVFVNGALATTVCEAAPDWTTQSVNLMPWVGEELHVVLKYTIVSGGNWNHEFYLDNVALNRICCAVDGECSDGNECTHDVCEAGICANLASNGCCGPALYNQSFDLGLASGWSLSANAGVWSWAINGDKAQSGTYSLAASVWNGQPVATLPALPPVPASGATLNFAYQTANWNVLDCETMGIRVWVNGVLAGSVCTASVDEWALASIDLTPFANKDITVQLQYLVGNNGNPGHAAWVDNVQMVPVCCSDDADCDDGDPCTVDSCGQESGCLHDVEADCCGPSVFQEGFEDGIAWGWSLGGANGKKWTVVADPVHDGAFALGVGKNNALAMATLPALPMIPFEGGYLSLYYQTVNWNQLDCATMGIVVRVNGAVADIICEAAPEWKMVVVDLWPWAGETPQITLQYTVSGGANGEHVVYLDDAIVAFDCP